MKAILSVDPIKFPLTGIGRYTFELARQLEGIPNITALRYLRGARLIDSLPKGDVSSSAAGYFWKRLPKSRLAVTLYQKVAPRLKARTLHGMEDYVFHGPNFYLPPFGGPSVATFHDLSPYTWADCHPPERVRYMRSEIELSLRRATSLITDSEFNRREVADYFGLSLQKIHAVPLASAQEFHPRTPEELLPIKRKYALPPEGYGLFIGTIEPRKNIPVLLNAYGALPAAVRSRWPLVLAGYAGWKSERIHSRIKEGERAGWVRYLGFLPADELPLLMAGARLFVFPSLYEGFGLPVLEAMATGVPVVCSNAASLPEVAGDAALLVNPLDEADMADAMERILENDELAAVLRRRGLARAQEFTWEKTAEMTVDVYRRVLGQSIGR